MQKLQGELKNTPRNTSLVPCSVSSGLNKEETLSDQNKVLTCNNSEENLLQYIGEQNLIVSVCVCTLGTMEKPYVPYYFINNNKKRTAIPPLPEGRGLLAEIG
jgi:hypothetical protein